MKSSNSIEKNETKFLYTTAMHISTQICLSLLHAKNKTRFFPYFEVCKTYQKILYTLPVDLNF